MRYHAHYHTSGLGHVYQQRYKSFPIQDDHHFFVVCRYVERNALRANLVDRAENWRWGSLWRWRQQPEPDPRLLSPWPLPRLPNWVERVNEPLSKQELDAVRLSANRGRPLGDEAWVESIARRSILNPRCALEDVQEDVSLMTNQTKRPDPFDAFQDIADLDQNRHKRWGTSQPTTRHDADTCCEDCGHRLPGGLCGVLLITRSANVKVT
jgi:putative transposase